MISLSPKLLNIWTSIRVMTDKYPVQGSPFDNISTPIRVTSDLHGRGWAYVVVVLHQNLYMTLWVHIHSQSIGKSMLTWYKSIRLTVINLWVYSSSFLDKLSLSSNPWIYFTVLWAYCSFLYWINHFCQVIRMIQLHLPTN